MISNDPAPTDRQFLFVLGSARSDGNTEQLARLAAEGLPASVGQRWLRLTDFPLDPFDDIRHTGDGTYPELTGNGRELFEATVGATDLVIVSPLYWYTVSTSVKLYLDHWSGWFRAPGTDFRARMKGRTLWGVTSHSGNNSDADPLIGTLRLTGDYMGMHWGGVLLGTGGRPGDVHRDELALAEAKNFFADVI
ncbi:multimeric flavodoxin WrbA [Kitasatospora gansuensis]|uniref:Multimeric flavodoxin WrbA n=1 Tax=Kitasatospora gansuensis TaxID=258050 RepID=A0A7W7WIA8_9ACTN|nr:NAD(P)H-dependent oxidoreductase [Kitasatospora gansuensis]MBB4948061.1 multimeric flavodoxin WrbA [Kitasatospora gansuensis]